jgi:hypothetical protein
LHRQYAIMPLGWRGREPNFMSIGWSGKSMLTNQTASRGSVISPVIALAAAT